MKKKLAAKRSLRALANKQFAASTRGGTGKLMPRRKWVSVPVPPTREMLAGMTRATFLNDGSLLEMERRFNGMLECVPPKRAR